MRLIMAGLALISLVSTLSPANARTWPKTAGWEVIEDSISCAIWQDFEGKGTTELLIVLNLDGSASASLSNLAWSTVDGESYDLSWAVNGSVYSGPAFAIAEKYDVRKGFGAKFEGEFINDIAKGNSLSVYRGDVLVDDLSLAGTGAAIAMAKRCLQAVKADIAAAEREKQRFAHIPDDPFAAAPTKAEVQKHEDGLARASNIFDFATADDYPAKAVREAREGVTGYALTVSPDGKITDCLIVNSSGHADLDSATCDVLRRRARFHAGSSVSTYAGKLR